MTLNQLRKAIDREPFIPFTLVLVAGGWKEYYIPDRDAIELIANPDGLEVIIRDETWGERWIDARLIAAIEFRGFATRKRKGSQT